MRLLFIPFCLLLLSGCAGLDVVKDAYNGIGEYFSGKDSGEPPKELQPLDAKLKLGLLWDASIGKGYDEQYVNLVAAVTEEAVYAVDHRGAMQARKRLNGEKLWSVDTELPFSAGPVAGNGKLVLGTRNAEVVAYNSGDGSLLWKSSVSSEILALPQIAEGIVVVRGNDGRISALNENTGATLWTYERTAPALAVRSRGAPLINDGLVIDGYGSGKLVALRLKDGKTEWEATVAIPRGRSEIERLLDLDSAPVVRGDTVYITGYQGGVAAVSLRDGEVLWRQEKISSHSGLTASRRNLFLTDSSSDVWQLDMRNGGDLWKQADLHQRKLTAPVLVKGRVVVCDFEGYLHVLSEEDGSQLARIRIDDSAVETSPVVFDEVVYVYASSGKLAAVSVE